MAIGTRLNWKSRTAVAVAALLLLGALLYPIEHYIITKLHERSRKVFYPEDDHLVTLPDKSTIFLARDSADRRIADWLKVGASDEQMFQLDNYMFEPASEAVTKHGWHDLAQLARLLKAYRDVTILVLYSGYGDDMLQLERLRAQAVASELRRFGVEPSRISEAPKAFGTEEVASNDDSIHVVLTRHRPS